MPSMPYWHGIFRPTVRRGSLLIEALLGIVLFAMFVTATFLTLLTGQESSQRGADRVRGIYYTQEALEVARSIRDGDFTELTAGQHGYSLDENGMWMFSGALLSREGYNTYLIVTPIIDEKVRITARTAWKHGYHHSGSTVLSLELTDWRNRAVGVGDWSNVTMAADLDLGVGGIPYLSDVIVAEDYAYVSSQLEGDGLYIFDVAEAGSPLRLSSAFTLEATVHKPVIYRDVLYLAVENSGDELKAFDVSDPAALDGATTPRATYDILGGTDRAISLARRGGVLLVGAKGDADESEFYTFDISNPDAITPLGELNIADAPSINDIFVIGHYAYLATSADIQELMVIDISNPSSPAIHAAYNAIDVQDGTAICGTSTGFFLGRAQGNAIDEFLLITGSDGVPSTDPGDTYGADMGSIGEGHVNAMDTDLQGCYAFIGTDSSQKSLQIRNGRSTDITEEAYVTLSSPARGVHYDVMTDRLYVTTNTGFHIFTTSGDGPCL